MAVEALSLQLVSYTIHLNKAEPLRRNNTLPRE